MAFKIVCIIFWFCVLRALTGLVFVFRGRIFSIIPVLGAVTAGLLLLAAIALLSAKGDLSWYEKGAKFIADSVFPTLAGRVKAMVMQLRSWVGGVFSSFGGLFRSVF